MVKSLIATSDGNWSHWPAPAKLNLFLRIVGRRSDGYHLLQTVFQILEWGDTVSLRVRSDGLICRRSGDNYDVPESDDLAVRAAQLLQSVTGTVAGVDLGVDKQIPMGGGFGGGSSDAATVLVALNHLWGCGLSEDALAALGLQLGADVPVFVRGRNAWAEGLGEQLTPISISPAWYLVVDTGVSAATRELFQHPDLTRNAAPATIADFVSGVGLGNAFEPVLRRLQRAVDTALVALSEYGRACLTGSGGGCFVRLPTQEAALAAQAAMPVGMRHWVVAGASRSPLHQALDAFVEAARRT